MMDKIKEKVALNSATWDAYYRAYQKDSNMPGVRYPNEHLVRFINAISKDNAQRGGQIMELGFGTIANMAMMQKYRFKVLGLEVSLDAVKRARRAIKTNKLKDSLTVDVYTGNTLPVEDENFDIIVGLQCVYYNIDQNLFAEECHRALKPGGKIFFSFFSPRHGYMHYIKGKPGSIVKFKKNHPNPRLRGLELFLFKSREQFKDIYGKYFDLEIGLDEFDLYPMFMSWHYLIGQKKGTGRPLGSFISLPPPMSILNKKEKTSIGIKSTEKTNTILWNKKYEELYRDSLAPGHKYPNEYFTRFLATRKRNSLNTFYANIGKEDDIKGGGEKVLELMPLNITNSLMASEMNYTVHGLSFSDIVIEKSREAIKEFGKEGKIYLDKIEEGRFPYEDDTFHFAISEKIGSYMPDQEKLVRETARVMKKGGEIFIGYISPRHAYMQWAEALEGGYYRITSEHPDPTMHGMVLYVGEKDLLKTLWNRFFDVEIKFVEYDLHRYFSSFYFVKAKRK